MCSDKFVLRASFFFSVASTVADSGDWVVDFAELADFLDVVVHLLVGDDGECEAAWVALVLVLLENGL